MVLGTVDVAYSSCSGRAPRSQLCGVASVWYFLDESHPACFDILLVAALYWFGG